jgi:hypothetical protein
VEETGAMGSGKFTDLVSHKLVVFALIAAAHGAFVARAGVVMSPDSYGYMSSGADLLRNRFDYATWARETTFGNAPLYSSFITAVALAMLAAGPHWQAAIGILNVLCDAAVGLILVRMAHRVTGSKAGAWCALILYLLAFDVVNWSHFVLSDMLNLLITFGFFAVVAGSILGGGGLGPAPLGFAAALLALALVSRPTSLALIPVALTGTYLYRHRDGRAGAEGPLRWGNALTGALVLASAVAAAAYLGIVQRPERWPFRTLAAELRNRAEEFRSGQIISARPETYHRTPQSFLDYSSILGDRFLHFFAFTSRGFSGTHNLYNILFFVPTYSLALAGVFGFLVAKPGSVGRGELVVYLSLFTVLDYALFHAMTHIDFDWRYRLPTMPHLLLIASAGLSVACSWWTAARVLTGLDAEPDRANPPDTRGLSPPARPRLPWSGD